MADEELELKTIFGFLETVPSELFKSSTPVWRRKAWSKKAEITDEEHSKLSIYSELLAQKVSLSMLLFAYNYFNFKKQTLDIEYERSIGVASQNILLLVLGFSLTPVWQRKAWSKKAEITDEEHSKLSIYSELLAQKVSLSMLLFAYNYFNFKKQTLDIEYERSIGVASQNILLLVLGFSLFLSVDSNLTLSTKIVIFLLLTLPIIALYGIFGVWRNVKDLQFYERVERLLEIAQKKVAEQNL